MTGAELKNLRHRSGLGWAKFGALIGFGHGGANSHTVGRKVKRLEALGPEPVPRDVADRAAQFERKLERLERKWAAEG
jgi:hypothetical protein